MQRCPGFHKNVSFAKWTNPIAEIINFLDSTTLCLTRYAASLLELNLSGRLKKHNIMHYFSYNNSKWFRQTHQYHIKYSYFSKFSTSSEQTARSSQSAEYSYPPNHPNRRNQKFISIPGDEHRISSSACLSGCLFPILSQLASHATMFAAEWSNKGWLEAFCVKVNCSKSLRFDCSLMNDDLRAFRTWCHRKKLIDLQLPETFKICAKLAWNVRNLKVLTLFCSF